MRSPPILAAHKVFTAELGIEPSPKLKDLQRAILLRERSLDGNGDGDLLERAAAVMLSDDRRTRAVAPRSRCRPMGARRAEARQP